MGVLRWSPSEFWNATFAELQAALEGREWALTGKRPIDAEDISQFRALFDMVPDVTPSIKKKAPADGD